MSGPTGAGVLLSRFCYLSGAPESSYSVCCSAFALRTNSLNSGCWQYPLQALFWWFLMHLQGCPRRVWYTTPSYPTFCCLFLFSCSFSPFPLSFSDSVSRSLFFSFLPLSPICCVSPFLRISSIPQLLLISADVQLGICHSLYWRCGSRAVWSKH